MERKVLLESISSTFEDASCAEGEVIVVHRKMIKVNIASDEAVN